MKEWHQVTIHDVAKAAKVSISTISKFLNGHQRFSPEVEERITRCVEKLGYQQNPLARSMATGQTGMIGLAIMDINNPNFVKTIKGATHAALANNYNILMIDLEESNDRRLQLESLSRRVDGMIVYIPVHDPMLEWLSKTGKPAILLGMSSSKTFSTVRANGYLGAVKAGKHLVEIGRKRIAYVGYPEVIWNKFRIRGLLKALVDEQVTLDVFDVKGLSTEAGREIAVKILSPKKRPDAIVGCNDLVTIGILQGARSLGLKVPEDVAIVGFDNVPFSGYVYPSLTTVDMCAEKIGETAVNNLVSMINDKNEKPKMVLLEPTLIVRESTVPAKAQSDKM